MANHDELRALHRPSDIRVLFVGESPPEGGTFFYAANSKLFSYTRDAFAEVLGDRVGHGVEFLNFFMAQGCFLDDLCQKPVNDLPGPERRREREAAEAVLAKRLSTYHPRAVIVVMRGIGLHVRRAMAAAGLQDTPVYEVSFPAMSHQPEYVRDLTTILRTLRRTGVLARSIAILGWGSLIWEPGDLHFDGEWWSDGPILPIEFARKSERRQNALTLVLHSEAERVPVLWAVSAYDELEKAIENLKVREDTSTAKIGFVSLRDGSSRSQVIPEVAGTVRQWTREKGLEATIWTDLASNFEGGFTHKAALAHVRALSESGREAAKRYILNTPPQIQTRLRPLLTSELTGE